MKKLLFVLSISTLMCGGAQASQWGYVGSHGLEHWGDVSKTCIDGLNQSPVDITHPAISELEPLQFHYTGKVTALTNNGHTLQATVSGDNTLTIDGDVFTLKQFHFHTPSENMIHHHQYPLEAHFVHEDKQGHLAVVAVMFETGDNDPALTKLTQVLPKTHHTHLLSSSFSVKEMLPTTVTHYYRFNGSLTTPPCSEGVRWFILKQSKSLSFEQKKALMGMMGHNNRPVQQLMARLVSEN